MKINESILAAFLVDAYSLGAHWVYDEAQLAALDFNWEGLNDPAAMWHKGKKSGDFTHYGDHTLWLLEYVKQDNRFDINAYAEFWKKKMQNFEGYIDGSSRDTLEHLNAGKSPCEGAKNHDLSICGRIAPLLLVSDSYEMFVDQALGFAKLTHNDPLVLEAVHFFATLLYRRLEGADLMQTMNTVAKNYSQTIQQWVSSGIASKEQDSFDVIRTFGPACGVEGGFAGTIHLLSKYQNLGEMMMANAQAGGDSSARGMIAGMILGVSDDPNNYAILKDLSSYTHLINLLK